MEKRWHGRRRESERLGKEEKKMRTQVVCMEGRLSGKGTEKGCEE